MRAFSLPIVHAYHAGHELLLCLIKVVVPNKSGRRAFAPQIIQFDHAPPKGAGITEVKRSCPDYFL